MTLSSDDEILVTSTSRLLAPLSSSAEPISADAAAATSSNSPSRPFVKTRKKNTKRFEIRQLYQQARVLERKGQWHKATLLLHDIICWEPGDAHSHLALARLEARRRPHSSAAWQAFEQGTTLCPQSVHLWQAWAVYAESLGRYDQAKGLFECALKLDPFNPYVCHAYGLMERRHGRLDAAILLWERALQKESGAALVCQMGEALIEQKLYKQARDFYSRHLVRLQSDREKTEVYLSSAWLEERYFCNYPRAEELIQLSLALNPCSSRAHIAEARLAGRKRHQMTGEDASRATRRRLANACLLFVENEKDGRKHPADGRMYNAWASFEVKSQRLQAARKILYKGMSRYPEDYALLQAAGKVEERLGNVTGARELYSASLCIQPSAPALVAYALLELGKPISGNVDYAKVNGLFKEALLLDPRHGPAYNSFGNSLLRRGQLGEARAIFERGVNASCSDAASVYHGYAQLELSLGNIHPARELLQRGLEEARRHDLSMDSPHRERALFLTHTLGMLELNSNRALEAQQVFSNGIVRYGNSSQLCLGAALSEVRLGNDDKARALFELSVTNDEKHAQAWQAWGVMEMRAGNWQIAKTLFQAGIKSRPKHGALWLAFAIAEGRLGNTEVSRALFTKGIQSSPNHVPLYQAWASLELREGNYTKARTLISESLTRDKSNGAGWLVAADIESKAGNLGLVNLILRRGIECAPTHAELYRCLGEALVSQNKINEARDVMKRGIEVDPMCAGLYHSLAELEARVFNLEGLADLNKKAALMFNANAVAPQRNGEEAWSAKIKARRSRQLPRGIVYLAHRIVDDDRFDEVIQDVDPDAFVATLSANMMEEGIVGNLLSVEKAVEAEDSTNAQ